MLVELHSHLYGCLRPDDLRWLAGENEPRWHIFEEAYRAAFGPTAVVPAFTDLFGESGRSRELLESNYYFRDSGNFARFQASFALIIAVASARPAELKEVVRRALARESADFVEYRMLFSPLVTDGELEERVLALAEGARLAEAALPDKQARIAVSLLRDPERVDAQYRVVRGLVSRNEVVRLYVTGIDFCSHEEGFAPDEKRDFCARVLADNAADPGGALAILYHVGESFEDKSLESAVRWVVEAARMGAHRLGHAIALGVNPEIYLGTTRREVKSERLAQIAFEIAHADSLTAAGYAVLPAALQSEAAGLRESPGADCLIEYDEARVKNLRIFQDWAMEQVRLTGAVIESCPTSNLRIGGLRELRNHPLPRFLRAGLKVVLGADDPGILDTTLSEEFEQARRMGLDNSDLKGLERSARAARSEILSGREKESKP